jgi:radical SAM protein with 4Fe4S-binding SPASM domain
MAVTSRRLLPLAEKAKRSADKLRGMLPVAAHHLEGELRDALYVKSDGKIDVTKPRRFYGILNERCNLRCQGCHYWRLDNYVEEMGPEEWIRVLGDIKDFVGSYHINFSGGEPLLKHGLFDILNYCRDNGILAGMTTNGIILRDRQAAQLVEAKLFTVNVSLDGFKSETHDLQRGVNGSHKGVLRTVDLMQKHSRATGIPVPLVIKPTVSRLNFREMPELVKLVSDLGVNGILFQPVSDWGTAEAKSLMIDDFDALQKVVDELLEMKANGYPILSADWHITDWVRHFKKIPREIPDSDVQCWVGLTTLVIKTEGKLHNCHTLDAIGNVRDGSIRDIWYSELARQRRAETVDCTIACSENCTIKRSIPQQVAGAVKLLTNQA